MTLEDLLKAKNLNFEVYMLPTFATFGSELKEVPDNKAVIRADTHKPMCGVGGAYEAKSYKSILEPFDTLIGQEQIQPIDVYSERGGARAHVRFRVPGIKISVGELELGQEFLVTTSHDGTSYWTLTMHAKDPQGRLYPVGEVGSKKIKHTKTIHAKIAALSDLFGSLMKEWHSFEERARGSLNVAINEEEAKQIIAKVFPTLDTEKSAKITSAVLQKWHGSVFPTHRTSVFGLYVAVCNFAEENRRVRMTKQRVRSGDQLHDIKAISNMVDKKLFSMWAIVTEMVS